MSLVSKTERIISESEYLQGELISDIKHEYIDGVVYAMSGASDNHNRISQNLSREIGNDLVKKNSSCDVFASDIKIRLNKDGSKYFYPDVMVICDKHDDDDPCCKHSPVLIVEVLSNSTRKYDLTTKKMYYFNIASLQEYVVIEQDICRIDVYRKSDHWNSTSYLLGDKISFESTGAIISVEDIYRRVENKELLEYLKKKEEEEKNNDD